MVQTARERAQATLREALDQAEREAVIERAALLESITDPFYALNENFGVQQSTGRRIFSIPTRGSLFRTLRGDEQVTADRLALEEYLGLYRRVIAPLRWDQRLGLAGTLGDGSIVSAPAAPVRARLRQQNASIGRHMVRCVM